MYYIVKDTIQGILGRAKKLNVVGDFFQHLRINKPLKHPLELKKQ